jgi:SAM-dependent MidA family methyltransferase
VPAYWHRSLSEVPEGPAIILANEFIDALPVQQAVLCTDGWHERVIALDAQGRLRFGVHPNALSLFDNRLLPGTRQAKIGDIFEWRSDGIAREIGSRVAESAGVALIIDYGHTSSMPGETLQAVSRHAFADPLLAPGTVDLTAHVDFAALAAAGQSTGVRVRGPVTQAHFLRALGIGARAASLKAAATPEQARSIDIAFERLTNEDRTGMGNLIKVIAFSGPEVGPLAGFDA